MSAGERTGRRDLLYSRWHRPAQVRRFIGPVRAARLEMIDLDDIETCPVCHKVLALIETKNSTRDPSWFPTHITAGLATEAKVRAFCVCYTCVCGVSGDRHEDRDGCDVAEFRVQQIAPPCEEILHMTPRVYAFWLHALREAHPCAVAFTRPSGEAPVE